MSDEKRVFPELPSNLMTTINFAGLFLMVTIIVTVWAVVGYHRWAISDVAQQISAVQEQSMYSTVLVAAIVSAPADQREAAVKVACPVEEETAEEALCTTLMKIFKASTPGEALDAVNEVEQTTKGGK
jgi:predicted negative regulator of RcsB-dependent stress response